MTGVCSNPACDRERDGAGRYCRKCHNARQKEWRKTHPVTEEQRRRDIARSYAGVYLRRGHIEREGCRVCGAEAQMHHPDYAEPLKVIWLCQEHHLRLHALQRKLAT